MRRTHMQLLIDVARRGGPRRTGASTWPPTGRQYDKSLTRTCLRCHADKADFCDRCHEYLEVSPHCWECHVDPKGGR